MADNPYVYGPDSFPDAGREKRSDYRLAARARVMIELEAAAADGRETGRWLACTVRDLSARGLCLVSPQPMPEGALLQAKVQLEQEGRLFTLTVEVIWNHVEDGQVLSGVRILEAEENDFPEWLEAVASALTDS